MAKRTGTARKPTPTGWAAPPTAGTKPLNRSLHAAKATKQDEFYTQLSDIEKELKHYTTAQRNHFKGKTVLCNCDDPKVSNFFHYFAHQFHKLGLKRLITTCYKNDNPDLFSKHEGGRGLRLIYNGEQTPGGRIPALSRLDALPLEEDGDFRSAECLDLLKQADIVVTNPPFSLFREYIAQLVEHRKKFVVIGNQNAISYKEIFGLIKSNTIWLGYSHPVAFMVPDHYEMRAVRSWRDEHGQNWRSLGNACWFTNMDIAKRHEELTLYRDFDRARFPEYDNYDAIEVSTYKDIPADYKGVMGVPVTFLEHHNPDQFEILGTPSNEPDNDCRTRVYTSKECRDAYRERFGKPGVYDLNARAVVNGVKVFARVLIRRK
ncbi:MAG: adenine-specific methyltransferase EcoRI family protein [Phycisphaerales bacterium]|nr:adenine-specific methyltransferase EcoRI family protein [Phycisphaerales bacterium]